MNNFDYIPIDKKVIDSYVKEFDQNRNVVISKVRFDNGLQDSIIALDFMDELLTWPSSNVNVYHLAYNVACNYLESTLESMTDECFYNVLTVINHWAKAFRCAYNHSSSVNFSWAFRQLLEKIKPLIPE